VKKIEGYRKKGVFKAPQVLAVDRDEDNLVLVYQTLEIFGYTCVVTQDRHMALNVATIYQPDLILLEISATHHEDLEILRSFKENLTTAHIPIIGLTTFTNVAECDRLLDRGCENYLCKPYLIEELGTMVTQSIPFNSKHSNWMASLINSSECTA
jgi:CheY-like chemotaxis protein